MPEKWLKIAFVNFGIAAIFGCLMRYAFVSGLDKLEYRYVMHAHSHVAMLGWLYQALFALIIALFLKADHTLPKYNKLFWLSQLSVLGMAVSFPIQGYGLWSIFFSMAHVVFSYIFCRQMFKDLKYIQRSPSVLFLKTGFYLMILSTIALWLMGPVMSSSLKGSALYYGLVQFFLHFQLNGWYIFAALAILFKVLENRNIVVPMEQIRWFYRLLLLSCFLTFTLAVTWSTPLPILFLTNSLGVFIQLLAMVFLFVILRPLATHFPNSFERPVYILLGIAVTALSLKVLVQSAVIIPFIAKIAYTIRNFVIGFIHLLLLGGMTTLILAIGIDLNWLDIRNQIFKWGSWILLGAILATEVLLFTQGTLLWAGLGFIPQYYGIIFTASLFFPIGIALILYSLRKNKA